MEDASSNDKKSSLYYTASSIRRDSLPQALRPATDTSYNPSVLVASEFGSQTASSYWYRGYSRDLQRQPAALPDKPLTPTKKLLQKIGSLRSPRLQWPSERYVVIKDIEEAQQEQENTGKSTHKRWASVDEEVPTIDISMLDGGAMALQELPKANAIIKEEHIPEFIGKSTADENSESGEEDDTLGNGMIIGARLRVMDTQAFSRAKRLERSRTVRHIAQREANRRTAIVAVKEYSPVVDIDSLAGTNVFDRGSRTSFDTIIKKHSTNDLWMQSYFFPEDKDRPNWKPLTMRRPYIIFLIFTSVALAVIQEVLCRMSQKLTAQDPPSGLLEFSSPTHVGVFSFFCWKYLPTFIMVTFGVVWQISDYEIRRLEPYHQLSRPHGATAAESLNMDYLGCISFLVPVKSFHYRQWAVFSASIATLLAGGLTPALQSASVDLVHCDDADNELYFVRINSVWSRLLTTTFAVIATLGLVIMLQLERKSGLLSNPQGIAGIAAMANKSHILADFQGTDWENHEKIHKKLKHRRYILYKSTIWQEQYITDPAREFTHEKVENPHPLMLRLKAGIPFVVALVIFLVLAPVVLFTRANVVVEKLPWLLTLLASTIKLVWNALETSLRMLEPFWILSKRNAPSQTLTLDYTGCMYIWMPIRAMLNKHYLLAAIGIGSILADVLTVCVSSFAVNGRLFFASQGGSFDLNSAGETYKSFWTSFGLFFFTVVFLISSATLVYIRRRHVFLPRQPSTIASVMAYIHQSKMLTDFVGTETFTVSQMKNRLKEKGKRYGLGEYKGRDGDVHCGVDEEPLIRSYTPGWTLADATAPWTGFGYI